MSSYCRCGHTYGEHMNLEYNTGCAECDCVEFDKISEEGLARGWD